MGKGAKTPRGKGKGGGGKAGKKKGKKKGKKSGKKASKARAAALAAAVAASELTGLEILGADGEIERLAPRFQPGWFYYYNTIPFEMDLDTVIVRATARDAQSVVHAEVWQLPADASAVVAKGAKSGVARMGGKQPKRSVSPRKQARPGSPRKQGRAASPRKQAAPGSPRKQRGRSPSPRKQGRAASPRKQAAPGSPRKQRGRSPSPRKQGRPGSPRKQAAPGSPRKQRGRSPSPRKPGRPGSPRKQAAPGSPRKQRGRSPSPRKPGRPGSPRKGGKSSKGGGKKGRRSRRAQRQPDVVPEHLLPFVGRLHLPPGVADADAAGSPAAAPTLEPPVPAPAAAEPERAPAAAAWAPADAPGADAGEGAGAGAPRELSIRSSLALPSLGLGAEALPPAALSAVRADASRLYDTFRPLGADPSARIDYDEFSRLLSGLRLGLTRPDVDTLFDLADAQQRGELSYAELRALLERLKPNCIERQLAVGAPPEARRAAATRSRSASPPPAPRQAWGEEGARPKPITLDDEAIAGAVHYPPAADAADAADEERPHQSVLVRVSVRSADGSAACHYLVELLCEQPAPTPSAPPEVEPLLDSLFDAYARAPPGAPPGAPPAVGLEAFVSCARSARLAPDGAAARAAFLGATRHKEGAALTRARFWTCLYDTAARATAGVGGGPGAAAAALDAESVLRTVRLLMGPLRWNLDACRTVALNRGSIAAARKLEQQLRDDQGRAQLQGERWALAPPKPLAHGRSHGRERPLLVADEADAAAPAGAAERWHAVQTLAPPRTVLDDLPVLDNVAREPEAREYVAHMHKMWREQQRTVLWPA